MVDSYEKQVLIQHCSSYSDQQICSDIKENERLKFTVTCLHQTLT
jgi:hypothetical protein